MTDAKHADVYEPEFIAGLADIFEEKIVFNRLLGLKITALQANCVTTRIAMRPDLIGHFSHQRLHGGVISACMDATGALAVMASIGMKHPSESPLQRLQRFNRLGTIDLRVDYLRAGTGPFFTLRAEVIRLGSRVANTRMEFFASDGTLLSTGAAVYIVS